MRQELFGVSQSRLPWSDSLLNAAIDNAPAWIMVVSEPAMTIERANPLCERMFGGSLSGLELASILADGGSPLVTGIREAIAQGAATQVDDVIVTVALEGVMERRHWSFMLYPWRESEDSLRRVLMIGVDSTDAALAQSRIERAALVRQLESTQADQATLNAVLEHLPLAVTVVEAPSGTLLQDRNLGHLLRANIFPDGRCHTTAAPQGWSYPSGESVTLTDWPLARCLRGETVRHEVLKLMRTDGGFRTFLIAGGPVRSHGGTITAAVLVWDDITLRAMQDIEREALLAEVVSQRTQLRELSASQPRFLNH
jgi:PAS domain-containing protein